MIMIAFDMVVSCLTYRRPRMAFTGLNRPSVPILDVDDEIYCPVCQLMYSHTAENFGHWRA